MTGPRRHFHFLYLIYFTNWKTVPFTICFFLLRQMKIFQQTASYIRNKKIFLPTENHFDWVFLSFVYIPHLILRCCIWRSLKKKKYLLVVSGESVESLGWMQVAVVVVKMRQLITRMDGWLLPLTFLWLLIFEIASLNSSPFFFFFFF
jgi:hypothetical protein